MKKIKFDFLKYFLDRRVNSLSKNTTMNNDLIVAYKEQIKAHELAIETLKDTIKDCENKIIRNNSLVINIKTLL